MSYGYIYRDPITLMVGVDYDCQDKKVYWTDIISGNIQRANFNGTSVKVVANGLIDPQGGLFPAYILMDDASMQ